jgi:hypothetical protein
MVPEAKKNTPNLWVIGGANAALRDGGGRGEAMAVLTGGA